MFGDTEEKEGELHLKNVPQEKREYPRIEMKVKVRYKVLEKLESERAMSKFLSVDSLLDDSTAETETIDVSKNGIQMLVREEIPMKSYVAVNMYIAVPGISANCKALAQVIRRERISETEEFRFKVALQFLKIMHHNLKNYKFFNLNDLLEVKEQNQ